jgi:hypothetical protein
MAHFAYVIDGIVNHVEVVVNEIITTDKGNESELRGKRFLVSVYPETPEDNWIQCSYSGSMRGCFPSKGYTWDGSNFSPPIEPSSKPVKDAAV